LLTFPALADSTISLLELVHQALRKIVAQGNCPAGVEAPLEPEEIRQMTPELFAANEGHLPTFRTTRL